MTTPAFFTYPIRTVTGDTSLDPSMVVVLVDATSGNLTMTLPAVATVATGVYFMVKKIDVSGHTVTITGTGGELLDGLASNVISAQYTAVWVINNGTGWSVY